LAGRENFIGECEEFIFIRSLILSQCRDLRMGAMRKFRSFNHRTCKTVLNLLEAIYLRF